MMNDALQTILGVDNEACAHPREERSSGEHSATLGGPGRHVPGVSALPDHQDKLVTPEIHGGSYTSNIPPSIKTLTQPLRIEEVVSRSYCVWPLTPESCLPWPGNRQKSSRTATIGHNMIQNLLFGFYLQCWEHLIDLQRQNHVICDRVLFRVQIIFDQPRGEMCKKCIIVKP